MDGLETLNFVDRIERVLQRTITAALLRLDPIWDPLRGDPSFQKLCEEKQS